METAQLCMATGAAQCPAGPILRAIGTAAARFLETTALEKSISDVLDQLSRALAVSLVDVFENHVVEGGDTYTSLQYQWAEASAPLRVYTEGVTDISLAACGLSRWAKIFAHGQLVYGNTRELPASERAVLSRQGVLSVLAVPVFVAADWWGYLQFDACARERAWSALELDAVKAVVGMLEVTGRLQESLEGNAVRV